jgi:poly(glycerol-phosphate) alpha-glucosyltransferase
VPTIFQLTSWLSTAGGGIPPVIRALVAEYRQRQLDCVVAGLADPTGALPAFPADWPVLAGRIMGPAAFGYSPELARHLRERVQKDSVIHAHGLWMYPGRLARKLSETVGAIQIISPHGMLEPWALQNSWWKKRLAARAFENQNLRTASCLHALCRPEADNIRRYGLNNPIAVIPNGVDLTSFANLPPRAALESRFSALKDRRWMLFLSRLHPKKGLPHLLKAWSQIASQFPDWLLVVAGPGELNHEVELKQLAADSGLASCVCFTGALHGVEKLAALGGAELFLLPSFSEGFSMAVLEAAAAGLPVMLTPQCNFPELAKAGGAVEVSPDAAGCEAGLRELLALPDSERHAMGQRGRALVGRSYTWSRNADQMLGVHRWLIEGGSPPPCVHLK